MCAGSWHNKNVYSKLFFDPRTAKRDWEREKHGIQSLDMAGVPTPSLLYSGFLPEQNSYILVLAAVEPAITLKQAWDAAAIPAQQLVLLRETARTFASHHNAGLVHHDPHLNNFLVSGDVIYTLDGADITNLGKPVMRRKSLANLAAFFATLHLDPGEFSQIFFDTYARNRSRGIKFRDYRHFVRLFSKARHINIKKYLHEKIFRECTEFSRIRTFSRLTILNRSHDSPTMRAALAAPEVYEREPSRRLLKEGNTSTVVMAGINGREYVIKHYKIKNRLHGLRKACGQTRAEISWRNAHRLMMTGVKTALPVAIIVNTTGPLKHSAFYITRHVSGELLDDYLENHSAPGDKAGIADKLAVLLRTLAANRITHGDMKASNIVVADDKLVLMDLDSMKLHRSGILFRMHFRKDLERLMQNWPAGSDFSNLIEHYIKPFIDEFV